jgi:hypothetical protein
MKMHAKALAGWDEGSAASITQLTSFRNSFHLNSSNAVQDSNTISNRGSC